MSIPRKLYHVTPYASKIKSQGFKVGMPEVFGQSFKSNFISFTGDKKWAEAYRDGLRIWIDWANGKFDLEGVRKVGRKLGLSDKAIEQAERVSRNVEGVHLKEEFLHYMPKQITKMTKRMLYVYGQETRGRLPYVVGPERLKGLNPNQVKVIEVTLDEEPKEVKYNSGEKEWRIYDVETLNRSKMKVAAIERVVDKQSGHTMMTREANSIETPPPGFLEGSLFKETMYHGSSKRLSHGHTLQPGKGSEFGIYVSPKHRYARKYGSNLHRVLIRVKNPLVVEGKHEISSEGLTRNDIREIEREGYDSIVVTSGGISQASEIVLFHPKQAWVMSMAASSETIPRIHRFVRFDDGRELFHAERDGKHYLLDFEMFGSLSYGVKAKGSKARVQRHMDLMIDNITEGVAEYGHGSEIETERLDGKAEKHFQLFVVPVFGSKLDWNKNTPELSEDEDAEDMYDFHKMLERQIRSWRGGRSSLNLTKHRYWPKFHAMVVKAVKKKYGAKIQLYRGIWGDQAEDALRGRPIKIHKFNSWSFDKGYAHGFVSGRKTHGVQNYWLVLRKDYKVDDVVFAPVRLPEYTPDPGILETWLTGEREAVIEDQSGILKNYRTYKKSRKKMSASRPGKNFHDRIEELGYKRPTTHRNMLDVAKKKREARLRQASYDDVQKNNRLLVYHGTQMKQVPALINGFDADKKMPRHFNAPRHPGLFVAPTLKDTGSFGRVVFEIAVKADDLHGTDYGGNVMDEGEEWDWVDELYPKSFRPGLSYSMDRKRAEPQAILRGRVAPSQIKRVNYDGKWYSRKAFLELVSERDAGMDLSSPDYDIDEFFDLLAESRGMSKKRLVDGFRKLSPGKREWQLERFNFGPTAIRSYLDKMAKLFGEREARQRQAKVRVPDPYSMTKDEFLSGTSNPRAKGGYRLLYHSTSPGSESKIANQGLLTKHSKSPPVGTIWASAKKDGFYGKGTPHTVVAFQVPKDDPDVEPQGVGQFIVWRDIDAKDIVAIDPYLSTSLGGKRLSEFRKSRYAEKYWDELFSGNRKASQRRASIPRTLWHISNEKFRRFNRRMTAQGILWFAKNKEDLVKDWHGASINSRKPVYLYEVRTTAKNPAGWDEYEKLMLGQIRQEGYDSIDLDDDVVILDDKDVKIVKVEQINPGRNARVAIDCDEFEENYASLLKQYHQTSGRTKKILRKTLDEMKKRLDKDCQQKRGDNDFVVDREFDPDSLHGPKATAFIILDNGTVIKKRSSRGFDAVHKDMKEDYLDKFPKSERDEIENLFADAVEGRVGDAPDDSGEIILSFWNDLSKSDMKFYARRLKLQWDRIAIWQGSEARKASVRRASKTAKKQQVKIKTYLGSGKAETVVTVNDEEVGFLDARWEFDYEVAAHPCEDDHLKLIERYGEHPMWYVRESKLDGKYQGKGIGRAMYEDMIKTVAKRYGGAYFVPDECSHRSGGGTSLVALNVWKRLAQKNPSSGYVIFVK